MAQRNLGAGVCSIERKNGLILNWPIWSQEANAQNLTSKWYVSYRLYWGKITRYHGLGLWGSSCGRGEVRVINHLLRSSLHF